MHENHTLELRNKDKKYQDHRSYVRNIKAVAKVKPEKDLCDSSAALLPLELNKPTEHGHCVDW